jgi:hypothetical protein
MHRGFVIKEAGNNLMPNRIVADERGVTTEV